jgi:hypothetical protein
MFCLHRLNLLHSSRVLHKIEVEWINWDTTNKYNVLKWSNFDFKRLRKSIENIRISLIILLVVSSYYIITI